MVSLNKTYSDKASIFTSAIKSGKNVVNDLVQQGFIYTLKTGYRALPIFFHTTGHVKLSKLILSNSYLVTLTSQQPRLIYKYLGSYLSTKFSRKQRLNILINHYTYLTKYAHSDFFKQVLEKSVIWTQAVGDDLFTIRIKFPFGIDFEGDLALVFEVNHIPIYATSFTFVPVSCLGKKSSEQAIIVSRVQGSKNFDLIKKATKSLSDTTPAALLLIALQGIALSFGIQQLVGVSTEIQLGHPGEDSENHFFDYNSFWTSFCAERTNDIFYLPVPFPEKPLASIKANHRSRTIRKRQFKHEVRQSVELHARNHFLC